MSRTLRVKIRCPHCESKIDVTAIEPEAYVNCPVCGDPFYTPDEEEYEERSNYPYVDESFQHEKTHYFSTKRNIVTKGTLRKMQRRQRKKPALLFGCIGGVILLLFVFAASRQSLAPNKKTNNEEIVATNSDESDTIPKGVVIHRSFGTLRPDDLSFLMVMNDVRRYLDSKDGISRIYERKRFNILFGIRNDLEKGLSEYPYNGVLKLRNGEVSGEIRKFSDEGVWLDSTGENIISWEKVDIRAFANLLVYVALNKASKVSLLASGKNSEFRIQNSELLNKLGLSYFHAAVLLDWYGYKNSALTYVEKALQLSPALLAETRTLFP